MENSKMLSNQWFQLKERETELQVAKYNFRKEPFFFEQLLQAVNTLSEQGTALRYIRDEAFNDAQLNHLIPIIIDISIDGNIDNIALARSILTHLKERDAIKIHITNMLDDYLATSDDFMYRRVAELLLALNFSELQAKLLEKCKESQNEDLLEIYDDFYGFEQCSKPYKVRLSQNI